MGHRHSSAAVWVFVLVVGASHIDQRPAVGLESVDNVPARHLSSIHTVWNESSIFASERRGLAPAGQTLNSTMGAVAGCHSWLVRRAFRVLVKGRIRGYADLHHRDTVALYFLGCEHCSAQTLADNEEMPAAPQAIR